jgi:hypothetical protein
VGQDDIELKKIRIKRELIDEGVNARNKKYASPKRKEIIDADLTP